MFAMERRPECGGEDAEGDALAEHLLNRLVQLINLKRNISDFAVIPVEVNQSNKSPIVQVDCHLGVESWCVKYIYAHSYRRLMQLLQRNKKVNRNNCDEVDSWLMGVLLFNPDVASFWNKRREMVLSNFLSRPQELKFSKLVLSHKPKCNEVLSYRRWLLLGILDDTSSNFVYILRDLFEELTLNHTYLEHSPNNYHGYSHRIWLMKLMIEHPRFRKHNSMRGTIAAEYLRSERWISKHISYYSGFHYHQFCLDNVLEMSDFYKHADDKQFKIEKSLFLFLAKNIGDAIHNLNVDYQDTRDMLIAILGPTMNSSLNDEAYDLILQKLNILTYELSSNEQLSKMFTSHETLWCHRRFIVRKLVSVLFDYYGETMPNVNLQPSVINEKRLADGSTKNITLGFNNSDNNGDYDSNSFGKEPKISRCENHSTFNSLIYKALSYNERRFIDIRSSAGDICTSPYELWLKIFVKFSV